MSVQNFTALHPIIVEIFQSGPVWWTNRLTIPDKDETRLRLDGRNVAPLKNLLHIADDL